MKGSAARRAKRATEAAVKRAQKRKPSVELATKLELESLVEKFNQGLQLLSSNQETLGKNFNQNLQAIQGAFHFVDAHQHVSRRILNDMAMGRLQMLLDDEGNPELIDYDWYHGQYHAMRGVVLFMQALRKHLGLDEEKPEEDETQPVEMDQVDDFTFGGDYADQNSS